MATQNVAQKGARVQSDSAEKICKKCGAGKPLADFYAHPKMTDGRDGTCKECRKALIRENRAAKADYYRAYDRKRYRDNDHRKEAARKSSASAAGARSRARSKAKARKECPEKVSARNAVNNALRDGRLERSPCYFCASDEKVHAHHEDYGHPLDVVWLCPSCHGKLHVIRGDMRRAD